ncbi:MAG: monovalent cation/H(+) antiporter subunit G [Pseudomonadota bacterium]
MEAIINILTGLIVLAGAAFALVAAIGILRFPDFYSRSHAASKAGTLGSGLLLFALAIYSADSAIATRALAAFFFLLLTAPIGSHLLARAAYFVGHKPWHGTRIDELSGKYSKERNAIHCRSHN